MNTIPTINDWQEGDAIDAGRAFQAFFGKSKSEAVEMFREARLNRQVDLMWMPFVCYQYYVVAYIEYLRSQYARDDPNSAIAFFILVEFRLHDKEKLNEPLRMKIVDSILFLRNYPNWFHSEPDIYGTISEHADHVLAKLKSDTRNNGG